MTNEQLADKVNEASHAMWHSQMIVDGARIPSLKIIAKRDACIKQYRTACAAWAASYFSEEGAA